MPAITNFALMPKFLLTAFLLCSVTFLHAQNWEIGAMAGGTGYKGDLNQTNPLKVSGPAFGIFAKYNFNGYFAAKLAYTYGSIAGADSTSSNAQTRARNLSFMTSLNELSLTAELNFFEYIPSLSKSPFSPYIFAGVAYTTFNPQASYMGQTYNLRNVMTEGQTTPYANHAMAIPYGVGMKYNFSGVLTVGAELGYRNPNTDYLDDVSGNYPDKTKLSALAAALSDRSGENTGVYLGTTGSQRGDGRNRDTYFFFGLTISYTFISQKCYY
jgi:outer membrane protein W